MGSWNRNDRLNVVKSSIVVNGVTAWLFASARKGNINLRAAFLHMAYDALVSVGVVGAGGVILLTGWTRLDPLVSPRDCRSHSCGHMGLVAWFGRHGP
jgi:hypothetical protein